MSRFLFGAFCVLFMQLFLPSAATLTEGFGIENAHAQYFKGEPYQAYPRPMEAPFASWQDANGNATSLLRHKGEVILLNFWATWCGPCVIEMPDLDAIQAKYEQAGLKVIAVSLDEEGIDKVRKFYAENNLSHLEAFNDNDGSSAASFNARKLPMSFLINHEGKVLGLVNGFARWEKPEYEQEIQKALRARASAQAETAEPFVNNRKVMGVSN